MVEKENRKNHYFQTVETVSYSEVDYISFCKGMFAQTWCVLINWGSKKDKRFFKDEAYAKNYFEILKDIYYFAMDTAHGMNEENDQEIDF